MKASFSDGAAAALTRMGRPLRGSEAPHGHIVLVGLSGSGKSTIGRRLATTLGRAFIDTDDLIVARAGKPIPRVFAEDGEHVFRSIEREAVAEAVALEAAVIATGGGAPMDPQNREVLWDSTYVIWLDAAVETLVRRVGASGAGRPLLAGDAAERLAALRAERQSVYAGAHFHLDTTSLTTGDAVETIRQNLTSET